MFMDWSSTVCRSHAIEHCEYAYRYPEPPYMLDCEHVLFSKCSMEKNAARIVTNMNMYVHIPTDALIFSYLLSLSDVMICRKLWYGHTSLAAGVDWMKFYNSLVVHE